MKYDVLTVREVAEITQKSEETVKRWLRAGKFPNAYKSTDKEGWRIPQSDVQSLFITNNNKSLIRENLKENQVIPTPQNDEIKELVSLAYQAVTMSNPSEYIIDILEQTGLKRTLEILLIMRQSPNKVKNPEGFIKKAIDKGWTPNTLPIKNNRLIDTIQSSIRSDERSTVPFYNWLEER